MLMLTAVIVAMATAAPGGSSRKLVIRKVNFDSIRLETMNPHSTLFYPRLLKTFKSNTDTTMTLNNFRHLYYGYVFQEDYNPFRESVYSNKIEHLYYKKDLTREECDSIEKYADLALQDNIFDLDQMKFFIYVLQQKKKFTRAAVLKFRLDRLIAAIMSSGKGTKEEPWVVITPAHEYNIINFLGYVATEHEVTPEGLDHIKVAKKGNKSPDGFYFDVSQMMRVAATKFPDQ